MIKICGMNKTYKSYAYAERNKKDLYYGDSR